MSYNYSSLHEIDEYTEYTRSYDIRHIAEIKHIGLGTYRVLKDLDNYILDKKIEAQFSKWDEQWHKIEIRNKANAEKENNLSSAEEKSLEAKTLQDAVSNILHHTLDIDDTVDWESLKDFRKFKTPNPLNGLPNQLKKLKEPTPPVFREKSAQPNRSYFSPKLSFIDKVIPSFRQKKEDKANQGFNLALESWEKSVKETEAYNVSLQSEFERKLLAVEDGKAKERSHFKELEKEWLLQQEEYYVSQKEHNDKIDVLKERYFSCDQRSAREYCEMVLNNSEYPDSFPKDFDIDYNPETKILLVEYVLPSPSQIPTLLDVKYIAARKELKESHLSESQVARIYDESIYKITLRTLHELFEADQADALDAIIFNGWVEAINNATGKLVNNCIVSIQSGKGEFMEINLAHVDPKTCFKNLKGIGSSKLSGIVAVQPIAQINKEDKRFVSSYDVADRINEGDNLASMDWEDFEHLLREIFGKEFNSNGGEVKVTQASRDGGVDAIAFDPDPIRGGKIVIQAKRYTNTVGVSAVRDLYGTVLNEGATKGILVTTADYGPDAYEFASNKPITLMNGSNLLYLLEKHGHKARIDLAEAKRLQKGIN
ncbi:restriction endonuclease [Algoriphagus aquimarinus]|uniref:restriction endonuclease n=1 Tax=Algoriphagus aquimarinus TaxID=237018 RepID=UPI0030D94BF1|tara:strand:+ start:972 stop:2765 length:1794 start_codon:yes stop_codon:yes gene_type:complete